MTKKLSKQTRRARIFTCRKTHHLLPRQERFKNVSARSLNLKAHISSDVDEAGMEGFRLVDITVLGSIFMMLICPFCKKNHVELEKDRETKMAFCSLAINVLREKRQEEK